MFITNWSRSTEFMGGFLNKEIQKPRFLDIEWQRNNNFKFLEFLDHGLNEFLSMAEDIYPELVWVFYCNLRLVDGVLISKVSHKPICLTTEAIGRIVGVPFGGTIVSAEGLAKPLTNEFVRLLATKDLSRNHNEATGKEITTSQLKV